MTSQLTEKYQTILDQLVECIRILLNFHEGMEAVRNYALWGLDLLYLFMVNYGDYANQTANIFTYLYNEKIMDEQCLNLWFKEFGKDMNSSNPVEPLLIVLRNTDYEDVAFSILKTINVFIAVYSGLYSRMTVRYERVQNNAQFRSNFSRCGSVSILDGVIEKATIQNWSKKSLIDGEIKVFYNQEAEDKKKAVDEDHGIDLSSSEAMFSK